ncbi:MAG: hypothetical protein ACE5G0_19585 [Rhodothermales bacterium]
MEIKQDTSARAAIAAELQSILRTNPRLRLEFLAAVSRLFREHQVAVEPEVLAQLTLTMEGVYASSARAGDPPPTTREGIEALAGDPPPTTREGIVALAGDPPPTTREGVVALAGDPPPTTRESIVMEELYELQY